MNDIMRSVCLSSECCRPSTQQNDIVGLWKDHKPNGNKEAVEDGEDPEDPVLADGLSHGAADDGTQRWPK